MGEPKLEYTVHELTSQRVNYLLFLNHLSQKTLALRIGVSPVQFNKKMNGVSRWAVEDIVAIADALGVSVPYLIGREPIDSARPVTLRQDKEAPTASAVKASSVVSSINGTVPPEGFEPPTYGTGNRRSIP